MQIFSKKSLVAEPLTFKGFVHVSSLKLGQGYLGGINGKRVLDDAVDLRAGKIIISGDLPCNSWMNFIQISIQFLLNCLKYSC